MRALKNACLLIMKEKKHNFLFKKKKDFLNSARGASARWTGSQDQRVTSSKRREFLRRLSGPSEERPPRKISISSSSSVKGTVHSCPPSPRSSFKKRHSSYGSVWLGKHIKTGLICAIKAVLTKCPQLYLLTDRPFFKKCGPTQFTLICSIIYNFILIYFLI